MIGTSRWSVNRLVIGRASTRRQLRVHFNAGLQRLQNDAAALSSPENPLKSLRILIILSLHHHCALHRLEPDRNIPVDGEGPSDIHLRTHFGGGLAHFGRHWLSLTWDGHLLDALTSIPGVLSSVPYAWPITSAWITSRPTARAPKDKPGHRPGNILVTGRVPPLNDATR